MNYIGRRLYYDINSGNVLVDTGEARGSLITQLSVEYEMTVYEVLAERVPESLGVITLDYGEYAVDFAQCNGYRVDVETGRVLFSYLDPTDQDLPPEYVAPLSEQVALQARQIADIELALAELFTA